MKKVKFKNIILLCALSLSIFGILLSLLPQKAFAYANTQPTCNNGVDYDGLGLLGDAPLDYIEESQQANLSQQNLPPDGNITNIYQYVATHYSDYSLYCEADLSSDFDFVLQKHTSYYSKQLCDENGNIIDSQEYYESNCVPTAMYSVMRHWSKKSFIDIPYSQASATFNAQTTISQDRLYSGYGQNAIRYTIDYDGDKYYCWNVNSLMINGTTPALSVMSVLYSKIRQYVLDYGYDPEYGFSSNYTAFIMNQIAIHEYGVYPGISTTPDVDLTINTIFNGKAAVLSMKHSNTYGNHSVAVIGFKQYMKYIDYYTVDYKYFYQIADGWHSSSRYFDPYVSSNLQYEFTIMNDDE